MSKAIKEQDATYKGKEGIALDNESSEISSDRDTSNSQLSAVVEYHGKIKERCIAKPDTYEGRSARREAEINGLKEAMSIMKSEAAFIQKKRRSMRGGVIAMQ